MTPKANSREQIVAVILASGMVALIGSYSGPLSSLFGQVYYFQGASNLLNGNGLTSCDGRMISWIPPGYTLLVTLFKGTGLSFAYGGLVICVISAGVYGWGSMQILQASVTSRPILWLGFIALNANPITLKWHLELTSDSVHASAVMLSLGLIAWYMESGRRRYLWIAMAAIAFAAFTRYIGFAAIVTFSAWLLFFAPYNDFLRRLWDAFKFGAVTAAPLALFFLVTRLVGESPGGGRAIASLPVGEQFHEVLSEVSRWVFNLLGATVRDATSEEVRIFVVTIAVVAGIVLAIAVTRKTASGKALAIMWMPVAYGAVYFSMMIILSVLLPLDDFTGRYVLPLVGPGILMFVILLDRCVILAGRHRPLANGLAVLLMLGVIAVPARVVWSLGTGQRSFGVHQMMSPAIRDSDFMRDAKKHVAAGTGVASNDATAQLLLAHTGRCVPWLGDGETTTHTPGITHLITADAIGIETGQLGIAAPRIAFSQAPGTYQPEARTQKPVGRIERLE